MRSRIEELDELIEQDYAELKALLEGTAMTSEENTNFMQVLTKVIKHEVELQSLAVPGAK